MQMNASNKGFGMKKQFIGFSLAAMAFFMACGDETTNVTETTGMTLIDKGAKMPPCTAVNAGEMAYSMDSLAAFFCADGKWQSLKGERGEQGDKGEKGDRGEPGEKGDDGKSCTAKALANGFGYKIVCGEDSVGVVYHGFVDVPSSSSMESSPGNETSSSSRTVAYVAPCKSESKDNCEYGKLVDNRDGQNYKTVLIGTQTWMAENLNYATEVNGTDSSSFCYGDHGADNAKRGAENCAKYGRLYTWAAAMDSEGKWSTNGKGCGNGHECSPTYPVRGICPSGWHLPNTDEWETLIVAVGGIQETGSDWWKWYGAGTKLKSTTGWDDDKGENGNGTDAYGFAALPVGWGWSNFGVYSFSSDGLETLFWSSTEDDVDNADVMNLLNRFDYASRASSAKEYIFSVRCLKD